MRISFLFYFSFLWILLLFSTCKKADHKNNPIVVNPRDALIGKYSSYKHYSTWNMWFDSTQHWQNSYWDSSATSHLDTIEIVKGNPVNRIICGTLEFDTVSDTSYTYYAVGEYPSPFARNIIFDTLHKTLTYEYLVSATKYSSRTERYIGTKIQ
jgi:hypothetical protein